MKNYVQQYLITCNEFAKYFIHKEHLHNTIEFVSGSFMLNYNFHAKRDTTVNQKINSCFRTLVTGEHVSHDELLDTFLKNWFP
jgi:hypothetical protein